VLRTKARISSPCFFLFRQHTPTEKGPRLVGDALPSSGSFDSIQSSQYQQYQHYALTPQQDYYSQSTHGQFAAHQSAQYGQPQQFERPQ
jgi:hypothetical protein